MPLPHPQTLQKLEVPIIDSEICSRLYWRGAGQGAITEDMLCAGYLEGRRDACLVSTPSSSPIAGCPPPTSAGTREPPKCLQNRRPSGWLRHPSVGLHTRRLLRVLGVPDPTLWKLAFS